jgi:hypothetical protein
MVLSRASIALRVAAIAAWGGFMIGMASWSNTNAALVGAGVATVLLGIFVGRWWVLLVPILPGALLAVATLVAGPEEFHENSPASWAAYIALWTVAIAVLLALGVALSRVSGLARTRGIRAHRKSESLPIRVHVSPSRTRGRRPAAPVRREQQPAVERTLDRLPDVTVLTTSRAVPNRPLPGSAR